MAAKKKTLSQRLAAEIKRNPMLAGFVAHAIVAEADRVANASEEAKKQFDKGLVTYDYWNSLGQVCKGIVGDSRGE